MKPGEEAQLKSMGTIVPAEGPQNAEVMLIGQNPGSEEARQRRPFVGRSGKYLDTVLAKNSINRSRLYITSVVKETTPGKQGTNRTRNQPLDASTARRD